MRVLTAPLVLAGVGLVSANPLRVFISTTEVSAFRLGHPAAGANNLDNVAHPEAGHGPTRVRHLCKSMKEGVSRIFVSIGLGTTMNHPPVTRPVAVSSNGDDQPHPHVVKTWRDGKFVDPDAEQLAGHRDLVFFDPAHPPEVAPGMRYNMGHREQPKPFLHRFHRALMTLGPWEGRAVAFVLGCGIGVIIRMFWVLSVVMVRFMRGKSNESAPDVMYHEVVFTDAEDIIVPPPQFTDEKVAPTAVDDKVVEESRN